MKKLLSFFILLMIGSSAYSINFAQVRVLLLDSKTMQPISSALVDIEGDYDYTDRDGEAEVDSLLTGPNLFKIKKDGYEEFNKVFFLYKGINYRKIILEKAYQRDPVQKENSSKNKMDLEDKEKKEAEYLKKIKDEESDLYWTRDRFFKPETQEVVVKPYEGFDDVRKIVDRLDGKTQVIIKLLDKRDGSPLDKVPVFINDSVVFSDKQGRVVYNSVVNKVDVMIDVKGIERIAKKVKLTKPKNYIEFHCDVQGGY